MEFDCPECGTHIVGEVSKCPKCGVEFVIEEVAEYQCPNCGAIMAADSAKCPSCGTPIEPEGAVRSEASGAEAAEETHQAELRKQFPVLVEGVKPLLALATDFAIDVSEGRRYIDKAVKAGRQRDVSTAVTYVKKCLDSVRAAIDERIDRDIDYLEKLADIAKKTGSDPTPIAQAVSKVKERKAAGDLAGALSEAKAGRNDAERLTGKYVEANELCDSLERLIQNSERFYIDVRDARKLLSEARDAGKHGDWSMMGILARKGREELFVALPEVLKGELKKAKAALLDAKSEGKDVSALVKILKEAGVAFKRGNNEESLERLIEFKTEAKHL